MSSLVETTHPYYYFFNNNNNNNNNNNYDRDSQDLHAGICTNPQKGSQCMNRMIDLCD